MVQAPKGLRSGAQVDGPVVGSLVEREWGERVGVCRHRCI